MQRAFVRKFFKKSSTAKQIWSWKRKFEDEGCLCRANESGRPATAEGKVERIRQTLLRSPKKSIRRTSAETLIPLWRVALRTSPNCHAKHLFVLLYIFFVSLLLAAQHLTPAVVCDSSFHQVYSCIIIVCV